MKTSTWLWTAVSGLFLLMACAWTAMFFFAGRAQVERVPLVSETGAAAPVPPSRLAGHDAPAGGPALPVSEAR